MDFLELGTDIEFAHFNRQTTEYHFRILNQKAVNAFLANEKLIKFLTDPATLDDHTGCRIKFEVTKDGELIISRQITQSTILPVAFRDLLITMNTYVMPTAKENAFPAWADMISGFFSETDGRVPTKNLARGKVFLQSPIAASQLFTSLSKY